MAPVEVFVTGPASKVHLWGQSRQSTLIYTVFECLFRIVTIYRLSVREPTMEHNEAEGLRRYPSLCY